MSDNKSQDLLEIRVVPNLEIIEEKGLAQYENFVFDVLDSIAKEVDFGGLVINPHQFAMLNDGDNSDYSGMEVVSLLKSWAQNQESKDKLPKLTTLDGNFGQDLFTNGILAASLESEGFDYVTLNPMNGIPSLVPFFKAGNYGLININEQSEIMNYSVRDTTRDSINKLYLSIVHDLIAHAYEDFFDHIGIAYDGSIDGLANVAYSLALVTSANNDEFLQASQYLTVDLDGKPDNYAAQAIKRLSKLETESWMLGGNRKLDYDLSGITFVSSLGMADEGISKNQILDNFNKLNNSINDALKKYQ